jgi:hypothetical protein
MLVGLVLLAIPLRRPEIFYNVSEDVWVEKEVPPSDPPLVRRSGHRKASGPPPTNVRQSPQPSSTTTGTVVA